MCFQYSREKSYVRCEISTQFDGHHEVAYRPGAPTHALLFQFLELLVGLEVSTRLPSYTSSFYMVVLAKMNFWNLSRRLWCDSGLVDGFQALYLSAN